MILNVEPGRRGLLDSWENDSSKCRIREMGRGGGGGGGGGSFISRRKNQG